MSEVPSEPPSARSPESFAPGSLVPGSHAFELAPASKRLPNKPKVRSLRPADSSLPPSLPVHAPRALRILRGARRLVAGMMEHQCTMAASAVAYSFFLSLFPLLLMVGFVLGHVVRQDGTEAILAPFVRTIPYEARTLLTAALMELASTSSAFAPMLFLGFWWTASSGLHSLMDILELVVGAPERPWWKKRAISLGYVVAGICILAVLLFLAVRVHVIVALVGLGLAALTNLAFFYRIAIEYHHRQLRIFWPGATLAVFVWLAMSSGFGVYATTLGTYAKYYGSLAAVTVLLLWLWLTALALLAGAELNSQLETRELNKRKAAGVESIPQSSESAST